MDCPEPLKPRGGGGGGFPCYNCGIEGYVVLTLIVGQILLTSSKPP